MLEDPNVVVPEDVYSRTNDPESAPDKPTVITIEFLKGDPVAIDGKKLGPADCWRNSTRSAARTASAASIWWRTASSA